MNWHSSTLFKKYLIIQEKQFKSQYRELFPGRMFFSLKCQSSQLGLRDKHTFLPG